MIDNDTDLSTFVGFYLSTIVFLLP